MDVSFAILAGLASAGAVAAMCLRNLVHCALCAALVFLCLAGLYLKLNAQFAGLAQILVYVGAVAVLIVFAILLTRGAEPPGGRAFSSSWITGAAAAAAVFVILGAALLSAGNLGESRADIEPPTVKRIGMELMTTHVLPLEAMGLLLTAAMIGAAVLAMPKSNAENSGAGSARESQNIEKPSHGGGVASSTES